MGNTSNKRNRKSSGAVMMRIAGILLVITALTIWGTSFLLAKYKSGGDVGSKARAARFEVAAGMEGGPATIKLEANTNGTYDKGEYTVTLTNKSETAVRAELKLDFSQAVNKDGDFLVKTVNVKFNDTAKDYTVDENGIIKITKVTEVTEGTNEEVEKTIDIPPAVGTPYPAVKIKISFTGDVDAITEYMKGLTDETAVFPFDVRAIFTQID